MPEPLSEGGRRLAAGQSYGYVGVRISIKFILDASGNRPANGNLNTDDEIRTEVDEGTSILHGARRAR